jgi:hypothetical protein
VGLSKIIERLFLPANVSALNSFSSIWRDARLSPSPATTVARAFDIESTVAIFLALFSYQAGRIRPRGQPAASQVLVYEIGRLPGRAQVYCHFFPEFCQFSVVI